jgi:hypothetical protein
MTAEQQRDAVERLAIFMGWRKLAPGIPSNAPDVYVVRHEGVLMWDAAANGGRGGSYPWDPFTDANAAEQLVVRLVETHPGCEVLVWRDSLKDVPWKARLQRCDTRRAVWTSAGATFAEAVASLTLGVLDAPAPVSPDTAE